MTRAPVVCTSNGRLSQAIVIVATHIAPAKGYGGVAESLANLARVWTDQGYDVRVVSSNASIGRQRITTHQAREACGCEVYLYSAPFQVRAMGFGFGALSLLWEYIGRARGVYIGGVFSWPTIVAILFCCLLRKAFVVGLRGGFMRQHVAHIRTYKPLKSLVYRFMIQPLGNRARAIHAMSPLERDHALPFFTTPILVAALGVDCRALDPVPPVLRIDSCGWRYLYVGRFSPEKSTLAMVQGWKSAARPQDNLTLVGDGPGRYADAVRAEARDDARITLNGYVPRNEALAAHRAHHFLILPSGMEADVRENFGIVVAESLALGRPALVARGLAWDDLEEAGAGFVFDPTAAGLAAAISRAAGLTEAAYAAMAATARAYAVERVDLNRNARVLAEVVSGELAKYHLDGRSID